MKKIVSLAAAFAAVSLVNTKADTIADWTFETSIPVTAGPVSPEIGSGTATGFHAGAAVYSSPVGNGSAHSFSSTLWAVGDYYQFEVTTVGYSGVTLSFDQASSNTGPRDYGLFYSVNGNPYTQFGVNYMVLANAAPNPLWGSVTYQAVYTSSINLSSLTALDNAATVDFRLVDMSTVSANGSTVGTGGTDRVDNFIVSAAPVPEPSTIALCFLGGLAGLVVLRRRS